MELKIGEYTIIEDLQNGTFKALRHGEEWRNLVGDNLILSMALRIHDLEEEIQSTVNAIEDYYEGDGDIPIDDILDSIIDDGNKLLKNN